MLIENEEITTKQTIKKNARKNLLYKSIKNQVNWKLKNLLKRNKCDVEIT